MSSTSRNGRGAQAVSVLRGAFDLEYPCDERSSRKMQQILSRRSEGSILRKRSSLMGRQISSRLSLGFVSQKTNRARETELTIQGAPGQVLFYSAPWRAFLGAALGFGAPSF